MKIRLLILLMAMSTLAGEYRALAQTECVADVNGYKIRTVYVAGTHYNAVVWAYKHLSDESCLTPVLDPAKADAILDLYDPLADSAPAAPGTTSQDDYFSVSCSSGRGSSSCIDSNGNELDVYCDGFGNCSSYYGPSPTLTLLHGLGEWVRNASYQGQARLFTPDHRLIWKSENEKGHGPHEALWMDKLRLGTLAPPCKAPGTWGWSKYKTFRHWASTTCGINFAPAVHIDIKANARLAAKESARNEKLVEAEEMRRNATEAANQQGSANDPQATLLRIKALAAAGNYEAYKDAIDGQSEKDAELKAKCHVDYVFPTIGMLESGVYCLEGEPEHVNDDALGSKQIVYYGGHLLIYISHDTGRVVDVQRLD